MSRLVLVRHAMSAHPQQRTMNTDGFRAWRSAYEAAGIRPGERKPDELALRLRDADVMVSSVVVTHASFRRRPAQQLQHAGWRQDTGPRGLAPWSAW